MYPLARRPHHVLKWASPAAQHPSEPETEWPQRSWWGVRAWGYSYCNPLHSARDKKMQKKQSQCFLNSLVLLNVTVTGEQVSPTFPFCLRPVWIRLSCKGHYWSTKPSDSSEQKKKKNLKWLLLCTFWLQTPDFSMWHNEMSKVISYSIQSQSPRLTSSPHEMPFLHIQWSYFLRSPHPSC